MSIIPPTFLAPPRVDFCPALSQEKPMKLKMFGLSLCFLPMVALAQTPSSSFNLPAVEKVLKNGLTVLVLERPGVPVVSFAFIQPVGAQDAPKGKTGLPHMLEHMMFKRTETIGTKSYAKENPIL